MRFCLNKHSVPVFRSNLQLDLYKYYFSCAFTEIWSPLRFTWFGTEGTLQKLVFFVQIIWSFWSTIYEAFKAPGPEPNPSPEEVPSLRIDLFSYEDSVWPGAEIHSQDTPEFGDCGAGRRQRDPVLCFVQSPLQSPAGRPPPHHSSHLSTVWSVSNNRSCSRRGECWRIVRTWPFVLCFVCSSVWYQSHGMTK